MTRQHAITEMAGFFMVAVCRKDKERKREEKACYEIMIRY
jgi:hypothetical protein